MSRWKEIIFKKYIETKLRPKQHGFFDHRNYIKIVRRNDVEIC